MAQEQSTLELLTALVDELKTDSCVGLASFQATIKALTDADPLVVNRYKFLLLDISQCVYDQEEVKLETIIDKFTERHTCSLGGIDATVLKVLTQLLPLHETITVPKHISSCDVAQQLLLDNKLITQQEMDWWSNACRDGDCLSAAVARDDEETIEAQLDKLIPQLNKLRDILRASHVPFDLDRYTSLDLASKHICWLFDSCAWN